MPVFSLKDAHNGTSSFDVIRPLSSNLIVKSNLGSSWWFRSIFAINLDIVIPNEIVYTYEL